LAGPGFAWQGPEVMLLQAMNARPREQSLTLIAIALTFISGAMDVVSFTRLGSVFTSVMTGNIVLFGLAVARGSLTLASHTVVSVAGYIVGVAGGTLIAYRATTAGGDKSGEQESQGAQAGTLPGHVIWPLLTELTLLAGFAVGWEISGASPAGWAQFCLLAAAAAAMGVQSSAVRDMGLTDVSTTYLTGTLTVLVSSLVRPDADTPHGVRRFGVLIGLGAGAILSGLFLATAASAVPVLPLAALIFTLTLASGHGWRLAKPDRGS
jgi:uncharacterized membrane protein YoaK (UPF0700 family)